MEKSSKKINDFFDEFAFVDTEIDNLYYEGSKFIPKSAFIASDDPAWWKDVLDKVHEMVYSIEAGNMDWFAEDLERLSYITANPINVDYELLKYFKVPDIGYYLDYLQTMEQSANEQDPEGFINAMDGLVDYIDSMSPKAVEGRRSAQEEEGYVDWDGIVSSVTELLAFARRQNMRGFMEELDYLNTLVLDHVSMPDDIDPSETF